MEDSIIFVSREIWTAGSSWFRSHMNLGLKKDAIFVKCANKMPYTDRGFHTSTAFEHLQEFIIFLSKRTEKKASSVGRVCIVSTHKSLSGLSSTWWAGCEDRWSQGYAIMNPGDSEILSRAETTDLEWEQFLHSFSVCLFTCSMFFCQSNHVCRWNISCCQQGALETQQQHSVVRLRIWITELIGSLSPLCSPFSLLSCCFCRNFSYACQS